MFFNSAKEINRRRNEINRLLMAYRKTEQTNQNKQIKQSLDWLKDEKTQ